MNKKIIGMLSIIIIIGIYVIKSPNLSGRNIYDSLSILFTSVVVTMFKAGIICALFMIVKKLIRK